MVAVNLRGNFNVLTAAGRIMTAQKSGSIVLFSSIRSLVTEPGQSVYVDDQGGHRAARQVGGHRMGRRRACA